MRAFDLLFETFLQKRNENNLECKINGKNWGKKTYQLTMKLRAAFVRMDGTLATIN
jgi:hypothetical protein